HHYDLIGKTLEEIFSPEIALEARQVITQTLQKGAVIEERKITLPSGKYWLKTISHAIRNSSDEVIGVQFISQDVTEKKELDHKILNTIINTEEKERMNFAQELHDGLGPLISAIKMYVQWLSRPDAKVSQSEILTDIEQLIGNASQTIKEISFKLSPHVLDNFGLIEAINTYAEKIKLSKGIDINITSNFPDRLDKTIETILYRILCECCNNTLKHANATKISLKFLKLDNNLKITYHDNGIGFMVENVLNMKTGNGLFNMQSRLQTISGSIDINSKPGAGTKITITVKL
ncbi:MAG TPA: ATP-binding protein, partial [Bacteroidales bacterium]